MPPSFSEYRLPRGRHGLPPEQVAASQHWRLLGACAEVMGERGYAGTTVSNVTQAAAVSKATFYRNFDGLPSCMLATYRLEHTPGDRIARTLSAWSIGSGAAIAVLSALGGLLAEATSPRTALTVAGLLILISPLLLPRRPGDAQSLLRPPPAGARSARYGRPRRPRGPSCR